MQMNMSPGLKPEVQTIIPKSIHEKGGEGGFKPTQIYQLVHSPVSEQAAFKVGCWSQFSERNITHSTIKYHLSQYKQEDPFKSFICYRCVTFGVKKRAY